MRKHRIDINNKTIFVTGAAGFIGYHFVRRLLGEVSGAVIIGIDSFTDYYDVGLKEWRVEQLSRINSGSKWQLVRISIADKVAVDRLFREYEPRIVVHLAAQAGVRYSIENPGTYVESNIIGFFNILEACRHDGNIEHLVYASSSSVYGGNQEIPFDVSANTDRPESFYAATKKADEIMAYSYSKLYGLPSTGLRFFTVYGPAGRPDMAYFLFTEKLLAGDRISIFNYGNCSRDFTYVDDIVEGMVRVMRGAPTKNTRKDGLSAPPHAIYNIGRGRPENLMDLVDVLSEELSRAGALEKDFDVESHIELVPMQPGDVSVTYADNSGLERDYGFKPGTELRTGMRRFVEWYREYNGR